MDDCDGTEWSLVLRTSDVALVVNTIHNKNVRSDGASGPEVEDDGFLCTPLNLFFFWTPP